MGSLTKSSAVVTVSKIKRKDNFCLAGAFT